MYPTTSAEITLMQYKTDAVQTINVDGTPEGNEAANVGSIAQDRTNGNIYVKKSGTGNTGWEQVATGSDVPQSFVTDSGIATPSSGILSVISTATNGIDTSGAGSTLTIGMASPYGDGDFSFTRANSGAGNTLTIANTSNTASSFANMQVTVGGATAADPQTTYTITGAQSWSTGIDNSVADSYVIAASTALGTTNVFALGVGGSTLLTGYASGSANSFVYQNSNNVANTDVYFQTVVAGSTAGDAYYRASITGGQDWSWGLDNSASDAFVIAASGTLGTTNVLQMQVSGNVTAVLGDMTATRSNNGGSVVVGSVNQSNTASSDAYVVAQTGGSSGGDPYFKVEQTGANSWSFGLDKSDSAAYVISQGAILGTNNTVKITTAGEVTKPLQPCFDAYNSATDTDVTGDGTSYTIICDTEVTDQGGDYDNTTGIFTAPVAGNYLFTGTVYLQQIGALHTTLNYSLQFTGGTTPYTITLNPQVIAVSGELALNFSKIVKLTAGGTAKMVVNVAGSTKTVDVRGSSDGRTSFSGALIC